MDEKLEVVYAWQLNSALPFHFIIPPVVIDSFLVGRHPANPSAIVSINVFNEKMNTLDISGYVDSIEIVQEHKEILNVMGFSFDEYLVIQFNNQLDITDNSKLDYPSTGKPMTFQFYPDRVYAMMYDGQTHYKANYLMSYQYADATPIKKLDIALDTIWLDSTNTLPNQVDMLFASAVVHNYSDEMINSFTLHYDSHDFFFCSPEALVARVNEVNIPAGESDTISFGIENIYPSPHGAPFLQIPFYIDHPNHHLDGNSSNGRSDLIYILSPTSTPIIDPIVVYPNPFSNFLTVSSSASDVKLILYNHLGQVVARGQNTLDGLGQLPAGVYSLQLYSDQDRRTQRVMKTD